MLPRRLFKLLSTIKNKTIYNQYGLSFHSSISNQTRSYSKLSVNYTNNNKLLEELDTSNPSKLLLILEYNKKPLNHLHIVTILKNMHKIYLRKTNQQGNKIEWTTKFFHEILSVISSDFQKLNGPQSVEILDLLMRMKVSFYSKTVQQIITQNFSYLNDLSLIDLNILSSLLRKMPQKPVKDLQSKLISEFLQKISVDFDENNIDQLVNSIYFTSYNLSDSKLLKTLFDKLENYNGEITLKNAVLIWDFLYNMNIQPQGYFKILRQCENIIINNIDELNVDQILHIIFIKAQHLRRKRIKDIYNATLLDLLAQKLIAHDMGFEAGINVIKSFNFMRHLNRELLNYTSAAYFEKSNLSNEEIESELEKLLVLITGIALAQQKIVFLKEIENYILQNTNILSLDPETLCITALNLVCLDIYPVHIFEKIFDEKRDFSSIIFLHWSFCKIYQILKSNENYSGPMPSKIQIDSFNKLQAKYLEENISFLLLPKLEEIMGGSSYVKSRVFSKLFHFIHHVVVLQNNGTPLPINLTNESTNDIQYIEDMEIPPDCKKVAFTILPSFWYFRNSNELIGTYKISMEILRKICDSLVIINENVWINTPEEEKGSLLMEEIQLQLKSNQE